MNEEPFGPVALIRPFGDLEEAIAESNRLPMVLRLRLYRPLCGSHTVAARVHSGMVSINHFGLWHPRDALRRRQGFGLWFRGGQ